METIGKKWFAELKLREPQALLNKRREELAATAPEIISRIPALIDVAIERGEDSIRVFGPVLDDEIEAHGPGTPRTVSQKYGVLVAQQECSHRPVLGSHGLTSRALAVFVWCNSNELECMLVEREVPSYEHDIRLEYDFHVRPRSN